MTRGPAPGRRPGRRVLVATLAMLAAFGLTSAAARQASTATTATPGLVAAYSFDAGSGTTVADLSGNGNTGTIVGATWVAGKYGGALSFNGSSTRVDIPDSPSLRLSGAMTLEAWAQPSAAATNRWRDLVYKGNDNYYLEASTTSGGAPGGGGTFGGKNGNVFATTPLAAATWTHVAVTYDGANLRFYTNGTLVATKAQTGAITGSANPLQIGGDNFFSKQYFSGLIDEVRVYNVALSAAAIQSDMTTPLGGGGGSDTTPPSAPGTLTATASGSSQINLTWGAATDNVGVTGYRVERCQGSGCSTFAQVGTTSATNYADLGLTGSTSYSYRVLAVDGAGNTGPYSNVASVTTAAAGGTPNVVAAYSFSEGTGTTVKDWSGNGNTGTIAGATWTTAGKFGNALSFNGTSARVDVADSPSLRLSSGMTLEAWVNPAASPAAWKDVVYKGNDNYYLEASTTNGGVPAGGGTFGNANGNAFGTAALTTGVWTHIAVTYDGATIRFYVNGALAGSLAKTGPITTSTNPLQIGGDSIFGQYFKGTIDEVRVYDGPLSVAAIQSDMTTPVDPGGSTDTIPPSAPGTLTATAAGSSEIDLSWGAATDNVGVTGYRIDRCQGAGCTTFSHLAQIGAVTTFSDTGLTGGTSYSYQVRAMDGAGNLGPVSNTATATTTASVGPTLEAAYSFEEGAGTTVGDSSGNGNTGTIVNATWTTAGKYGNALSFNGTSARVDIPDSPSLRLSGGMTLEAWVNPAASPAAWKDVVYKGNDNYYLEASTTSGGNPAGGGTFGGANANAFGTAPLPTATWTHIAVTYDGATLRFYVNGVQVGTKAQTGAITGSTNPLEIGGDTFWPSQYFKGSIDEVRVYNGPLSASQIQADMNTGLSIPTAPTNLTATIPSSTEVDLTWGASSDAAGVTGYRVERCQGVGCSNFAQIAAPTATSYNDTGLTAGTSYTYRVRAIDAQGHLGPYSDPATAYTGLSVAPRQLAMTPGQAQTFTASAPGGGSVTVTWSVDGIAGGDSSTGTITSGGVYTAPAGAGTHTVTATQQGGSQSGSATVYVSNYNGMFTYHDDNLRTGVNPNETVLTPANVNSTSFGKLFSRQLDGITYASPLYVRGVSVPGQGTHNVVYVATEHDSVYAFDADGGSSTPLWKDSFIDPANGVTTVPNTDTGECCDIPVEIGITSTPVIDPATNTIYVVAKTKEVSGGTTTYVQRLHALDLSTGAEKFGGPVVIQATVPGTGTGSTGGQLPFNALRENQRTALLLLNGTLYFGFSSHGDNQPYHGWIFGYDAATLTKKFALCLTPNDEGAGVWMSGDGLAADASGSIFFVTGDGEFTASTGGLSYGDSYVKMSQAGAITDYFSPFNQASLNSANHDLGSGGLLLLPDQPGAHPHEMLASGKDGAIYLVDRDNLGQYNGTTNTNIQTLTNVFPNGTPEPGNFSAPVYFNGYVFFGPSNDNLQAFKLTNGLLSTTPTFRSAASFVGRGASMSVSANGTSNGILWTVDPSGSSSPGVLYAYDPTNSTNGVLKELYDSNQAGTRDTLDPGAKFNVPLVANGKVFVAGTNQLTVYGLLP